MERAARVIWLQDKKCQQPRKLEEVERILPYNLQREQGPADIWFQTSDTDFGFLVSRTVRE